MAVTKQIVIKSASKGNWYEDRIGEVFDIDQDVEFHYVVWTPNGRGFVKKTDAHPYTETDAQKEARAIDAGQPYPPEVDTPITGEEF